jgi:hypothetical protein
MSNSERRKTKVETPPMVSKTRRTPPIVSKSRRTQRRPIEARLQGHARHLALVGLADGRAGG